MEQVEIAQGAQYPTVFVDGKFEPLARAAVSVHANALSYGTGVFEGLRACWNAEHENLYLLEPDAHYDRMHWSAHALGIGIQFSTAQLTEATVELLRRNRVRSDAYIRPLLILSGEKLNVRVHDIETRFSIAVWPFPGAYIDPAGVRCMVSSWQRCPDVVVPIRAKICGSYVGPALAKTEAIAAGYDEAIMLTTQGHVSEASTSNVFIRRCGRWVTPPVTDDILEGITRREVMRLIEEELGESVLERSLDRSELYSCDEALLCGTAVGVVPIVEVDGRRVDGGQPGEQTVILRDMLLAIARRADPRHQEWTTAVFQPAAVAR